MPKAKRPPPSISEAAKTLIKKVIRAVERQPEPETLYHYTSAPGLLGILKQGSVWATNIRFMNDTREFGLALELMTVALERRSSDGTSRFMSALHQVLREALRSASSTEFYVSSFSEDGDQLSQWRGYCPSGSGYSIGVRPITLTEADADGMRFLVPCIYDKGEHKQLVETVTNDVIAFANTYWTGPDSSDRVLRESFKVFERVVSLLGPALKDTTFREEVEWRLVSLPSAFSAQALEFRPGRATLVPYFSHPLGMDGDVPLIAEIVIGPTAYPDLARRAAEDLLRKYRLRRTRIRASTIPFRDW